MLELSTKQKFVQVLTLIFLSIFPITGLVFLHNHYITLVIVLVIGLLFLLTLLFFKESRQNFKYVLLYYFLCSIYIGISWWKSYSFNYLVPTNYNVFKELMTITKLLMPGTFFYCLYYQRISKDKFLKVAKLWIILIAGSIVVTNLFKVSLASYSDTLISYNILEWSKSIYYLESASKGYFTYANQVAVVLLCLLVVAFNLILKKKRNIFYIFLICLAMLMLGTRVSSLGGLLTLLVLLVVYFVLNWYQKEKVNHNIWLVLGVIGFWGLMLPISPFMNRNIELNQESNNVVMDEKKEIIEDDKLVEEEEEIVNELSEKQQFVLNNYNPDYLPKVFFEEYYPMQYDEDFWYNIIKNNKSEDLNYRYVEKKIVKRMVEINDNNWDVLFGISNVRIQNIVNVERDFLLHYYAFGLVGSSILLAFYIMIISYSIYNFWQKRNFNSFLILSCSALFVFSAYLTGNIVNSLFPTVSFVVIINCLLDSKNVKKLANN